MRPGCAGPNSAWRQSLCHRTDTWTACLPYAWPCDLGGWLLRWSPKIWFCVFRRLFEPGKCSKTIEYTFIPLWLYKLASSNIRYLVANFETLWTCWEINLHPFTNMCWKHSGNETKKWCIIYLITYTAVVSILPSMKSFMQLETPMSGKHLGANWTHELLRLFSFDPVSFANWCCWNAILQCIHSLIICTCTL